MRIPWKVETGANPSHLDLALPGVVVRVDPDADGDFIMGGRSAEGTRSGKLATASCAHKSTGPISGHDRPVSSFQAHRCCRSQHSWSAS